MPSIIVKGLATDHEEVPIHQECFTKKIPFTVNERGHRRQLAPDVAALLSKAHSRYRMAVRQADGFIAPHNVPPVTVTSIRDSQGEDWSASITYGHNTFTYTNWCGEVFPIVFE